MVINPDSKEVQDRVEQLTAEHDAICRGWQQKDDWLRQLRDKQLFEREADQIDAMTSTHENFLHYADLGVSIIPINTRRYLFALVFSFKSQIEKLYKIHFYHLFIFQTFFNYKHFFSTLGV